MNTLHHTLRYSTFAFLIGTSSITSAVEPPQETAPEPNPKALAISSDTSKAKADMPLKIDGQPRIEITFVLDTTGSMSGLIEGAKQKIWSIASDIISAKPKPLIRFGLVGYRDRGDDYVTKRAALTDDLDTIYAELQKFKADGGGDTPESVSEALHEALTQMPWTKEGNVLKVIYLVGDAPPQEYKDGKDWREVCKQAMTQGIHINTIQCGSMPETTTLWKMIASYCEGAYAMIPQDGNMVSIAAPQDEELLTLNEEIGKTLIPYGKESVRNAVISKQKTAEVASPVANASRLKYNSISEKVVQGTGELIDAIKDGKQKLDDVKPADLPEDLRGLSQTELKEHIEKKQIKRAEIQTRITTLVKERDAFIKAEREKQSAINQGDSFDTQVAQTLREQARKKGIVLEK
ncbi:Mg-chelatase subunit ChlD [Prosthecobacter debontii]|uniref:Mg-chelatase subunit ChlD n=1 Tax=Prosthecobacter debontii TaxID=48467 RepID=A0A1T4Z163_9BACT|nr:vWA domain-containing protein [Prosthecobacter debontii]SKB07779.1 Mg-chelatase subunit ChlD [Prosthecobacter debontii]